MPLIEIPMSMIADCPASGTSVGLGSVTEPIEGRGRSSVMLSPTIFVSLAGHRESALVIEEGVVLMMNES